jgi:SH3 domain protein
MRLTPRPFALALCLILLWQGNALATYITDKVEVELRAQAFGQGAVLGTLQGGDDVEVLSSDGDYARIQTANKITGWIEARYLSDSKPKQADVQALKKELQAAKDKLQKLQASVPSDAEMKKLQQAVKDASWLRVELNKAREKIKALEAAAQSSASASSATQQELEALRASHADLEQRLAAALLINEQQQMAEISAAPDAAPITDSAGERLATQTTVAEGWSFRPQWFLGSIFTAIIIGIILGMVWMDRRMRRRHGGFRLY